MGCGSVVPFAATNAVNPFVDADVTVNVVAVEATSVTSTNPGNCDGGADGSTLLPPANTPPTPRELIAFARLIATDWRGSVALDCCSRRRQPLNSSVRYQRLMSEDTNTR